MARPIRSKATPLTGLRGELVRRTEGKLARAKQSVEDARVSCELPIYDFRPEVVRLATRLRELQAGRPVQVHRAELPRGTAPGPELLFWLRGDALVAAEYERRDGLSR
ncbi:hypothetical protein [Nocardia mangyaensis]|uniref:hypothetical protein n=1 Tax=Nocardia mangyaensis TaxID=2213200 RepID=UPI002674B49A|nr:hypothetical protein [Nocardia mangyaensis]MDO3647685.1 hypothetical protein [Nocardia mangyaensis]